MDGSPNGRQADERRPVVVFDLDGTLVTGDAFGLMLRRLLVRNPVRLATALCTAPVWAALMGFSATRTQGERWLVWVAAAGLDDDAFARVCRKFATGHAGPQRGRVIAAALARLQGHVERGDQVVVATACAEPLAREICRVLGLADVLVVASPLTRSRFGLPATTVPARGEDKLRAVQAAGIELPVDHVYSDNSSDLPLFRNARVAHVIDPTPARLDRLRRELGPHIRVLRWRSR